MDENKYKISNSMNYEFLSFTKKDISSLPNTAKQCSNYKNNEKTIHLPPYFFCTLCLQQFCYSCTTSHLINNKDDKKHSSECMVTKELINKRKDEIMKKSSNFNDNFFSNYKAEIEFIENERIVLSNIKNAINEKLDKFDNYLEKKKNFLKNMNVDILIKNNKSNKNNKSDKDCDILESLNNLNILLDEEEIKKKVFYTSLGIYKQIDEKIEKKKNKITSEIISNINVYKDQFDTTIDNDNDRKDNNIDNKFLNHKRTRADNDNIIETISFEDTKEALNILFPSFKQNIEQNIEKKAGKNVEKKVDKKVEKKAEKKASPLQKLQNNKNIINNINKLVLPVFD